MAQLLWKTVWQFLKKLKQFKYLTPGEIYELDFYYYDKIPDMDICGRKGKKKKKDLHLDPGFRDQKSTKHSRGSMPRPPNCLPYGSGYS